jgi:hypothetical protein
VARQLVVVERPASVEPLADADVLPLEAVAFQLLARKEV